MRLYATAVLYILITNTAFSISYVNPLYTHEPFLYGSKPTMSIEDWEIVTKDAIALAYSKEKSNPVANPGLIIDCSVPKQSRSKYRIYIQSPSSLNTEDPEFVKTMVTVDDKPGMENSWYPFGNRLFTSSQSHIKNRMLKGSTINLRLRNNGELVNYKYGINGLDKVFNYLAKVCGYEGNQVERDAKFAIIDSVRDMNRGLPANTGIEGLTLSSAEVVDDFTIKYNYKFESHTSNQINLDIIKTITEAQGENICKILETSAHYNKYIANKVTLHHLYTYKDMNGNDVFQKKYSCQK